MKQHSECSKLHNTTIGLTTLTPISVGSGEVLSPYADYVYDERTNEALIIDKDLIENMVDEKGLTEEYVQSIYNSFDNNRSNFDLKSFIERELQLTKDQYAPANDRVNCLGMQRNYRREVKGMLKDNNRPYVPGSTLKGAIKTTLLYDWLKNEEEGQLEFSRLMRMVLEKYELVKDQLKRIESLSGKNRLDFNEKKELKNLIRQVMRQATSVLSRLFDDISDKFMDKDDEYLPKDASLFRVGDTQPLSPTDRIFQLTNRLHYDKGTAAIPVNLEAIPKRKDTHFRLSLLEKFSNNKLNFLNNTDEAVTKLFYRINNFSKHNVDMELDLLDRYDWHSNARRHDKQVFHSYQDFLEQLYDRIQNAPNGTAYLPLGFGKSFFYNSIGMLVADWEDEKKQISNDGLFEKYCGLFSLGKTGQKRFPLTRTVTSEGEAMGWVKLKLKNQQ